MNSDKKMTCISAETGTKIFAVFNMIIVSVCSLFFFAAYIYFIYCIYFATMWANTTMQALYSNQRIMNYKISRDAMDAMVYTLIFIALSVAMLICFKAVVFSAFLVNGVFKKKPEHIKVYFIYGVLMIILTGLATLSYMVLFVDVLTTSVLISGHFMYSLVLIMIRKTYKNYEDSAQFDHKILDAEKF